MKKSFDIIVWGATGFTGQLVVDYLCERVGVSDDVQWAIAGRNPDKLAKVRDDLASRYPQASDLEILVGDSHDIETLNAITTRTKVVISTVGPYLAHGANLVASCVANGADYVDLTGETPFIRKCIEAHHEDAVQNSRRIVHSCGFDSIPSDIGVYFLQGAATKQFGTPLQNITFYLEKSRGGVSGGTIASMMLILDHARDPAIRRVLGNPYGLNPKDGVRGPDGSDQKTVQWDTDADVWTAPFVMAGINTRIVRRSNALMDYAYGQDFSYREVISMKKGMKGWFKAQSMTFGLGTIMALAIPKLTRALLLRTILPQPGEGPSAEEREAGSFRIRLRGKSPTGALTALVHGKRDPGYGATARMLAESALCLAKDEDALPKRFGVLTPASAMGDALIERLKHADITFSIVDGETA